MTGLLNAQYDYDLTSCDLEPIHRPGAIQEHGALLVLRERDLTVVQASVNIGSFVGFSHLETVGSVVGDIVGVTTARLLRTALSTPGRSGAESLPLRAADGAPLDLTWHRLPYGGDRLVVVELERASVAGPPSFIPSSRTPGTP